MNDDFTALLNEYRDLFQGSLAHICRLALSAKDTLNNGSKEPRIRLARVQLDEMYSIAMQAKIFLEPADLAAIAADQVQEGDDVVDPTIPPVMEVKHVYPDGWPQCLLCELPIADGHLTCARTSCPERLARDINAARYRKQRGISLDGDELILIRFRDILTARGMPHPD